MTHASLLCGWGHVREYRAIKQVKRSGFGFRRFDNYRLRVLYRCG